MKLKQSIFLLLILISIKGFSQRKYKVGGVRFDSYLTEYNTDFNYSRVFTVLGNESFNTEKENNYTNFSNSTSINKLNYSLDFLIKRCNKSNKKWLHHEFTFGFEYGKTVTNFFRFHEERRNGGINLPSDNGFWIVSIFLNSTDYVTKTILYEYQSEFVAFRAKEMVWILNGSYFSIGIGFKGSLGFKFNSKVTKTILKGSRSVSLFDESSSSTVFQIRKYNDKNGMIGNISFPIELSCRFSKNKKSSFYYTKLIGHLNYGVQQSFFTKREEKITYSSGGLGLQIGF
jgi:hypothetical protein